jgi:hypothetical protein
MTRQLQVRCNWSKSRDPAYQFLISMSAPERRVTIASIVNAFVLLVGATEYPIKKATEAPFEIDDSQFLGPKNDR